MTMQAATASQLKTQPQGHHNGPSGVSVGSCSHWCMCLVFGHNGLRIYNPRVFLLGVAFMNMILFAIYSFWYPIQDYHPRRRILDANDTHADSTIRTQREFEASLFLRSLHKLSHRELNNSHPYLPWTREIMKAAGDNDTKKAELIRSEYGMETFMDDYGQVFQWENGVQYRPHTYLSSPNDLWHSSPLEPYIPFDVYEFFLHDQSKIKAYASMIRDAEKSMFSPGDGGGGGGGGSGGPQLHSHKARKIIQLWTDKPWIKPNNALRPLPACPDFPCLFTQNRSFTEESSALIANGQYTIEPPPKRRSDAVMVFYQIEAPWGHTSAMQNFPNNPIWEGVFNWTMSYRWDADIPVYYGLLRKRLNAPVKNYQAIVKRKDKKLAWLVFNTNDRPSRRFEFVKKLEKLIPVERPGKGFTCLREKDWECMDAISAHYKFYLAFENSYCDDYITEKFYKYYNLDVILIVRGGGKQYSNIAPPGTYINADKFESVEALADHLKHLDAHPEEYIKMLKEKDKYVTIHEAYLVTNLGGRIELETRYEAVPLCHICHRLWNLEKYTKTIPSISKWFSQSKCYPPKPVR